MISLGVPVFRIWRYTVELQWLEHWCLVYHGCFELVLESLGNNPLAADLGNLVLFSFFYIENGILCVLIRIASQPTFILQKIKEILIMSPDLALLSTLIGSNFPCLEQIFMVPKVFEPLKFYCIPEWVVWLKQLSRMGCVRLTNYHNVEISYGNRKV